MKSFMIIGLIVLYERIFEGVLPYMDMAAILVMRPVPFIFIFATSQGGSTWNLALIGKAVSEKKMLEINGYIHVYSPRTGTDNTLRLNLIINCVIQ